MKNCEGQERKQRPNSGAISGAEERENGGFSSDNGVGIKRSGQILYMFWR